jgi:hypothetical protein
MFPVAVLFSKSTNLPIETLGCGMPMFLSYMQDELWNVIFWKQGLNFV